MIIIQIIMVIIMITRYASEFLQNVSVGRHRQCGDSQSNVIIEEFKDSREVMMMMVKIMVMMRLRLIMMGSVDHDVDFNVDHEVYHDLDHHWWFTRWWSSGLRSRALI